MAISLLKASRALLFVVALTLAVPAFGQYPYQSSPPPFDYSRFPAIHHRVPFHAQDTMVWCWVAAAKMICEYYGRRPVPNQCEMLQMQYHAPCCQDPRLCSRAGQMGEVQALIARYGGRFSSAVPPADGFALYGVLRRGPILMQTRQGMGHAVVATGIRIVPSPIGPLGIVSINDPYYGQYEITFPELINAWSAALLVY
jgi:hypothetical protein